MDTKDGEVIIAGVGKAVTAITARLTSLSQFDGTESKVRLELEQGSMVAASLLTHAHLHS